MAWNLECLLYDHGLVIFPILAQLPLGETGEIYGFQAFLQNTRKEWPEIWHAGVSWASIWTDHKMVAVCRFSSFWRNFDLVEWVKFVVSGHFPENT